MYAQVTSIEVPLDHMDAFRELVRQHYLPVLRSRVGFRAGYLLEQADDPDRAQIILFWSDQAAAEAFSRTGALEASVNALAAAMPGVIVHRLGYVVQVATGGMGWQLIAEAQESTHA
jgi:quinol monooxygenase YgiN